MSLDADLVASIYEAAAVPEQWPAVLAELAWRVDAFGGALVSLPRSRALRFVSTANYHEPYLLAAEAIKVHTNVRPERAFARRYYGFLPDTELCTMEELDTDPIYVASLHPFGIGWTIGAPVSAPSADLAFFDLCRLRKDEPFGRSEAELLDGYKPHLARAALLATRLELERARAATAVLDAIGIPGAILKQNQQVLAANQLFTELGPPLTIQAYDRLDLGSEARNDLLRRAQGPVADVGSIPVPPTGDAPGLVIHVVPIERAARDVLALGTHIVIVTPVTAPAAPLTELLVGLFDLTPAEAAVARLIASGENLDATAEKNGVSRETIKAQLRSVFSKTGTHRQADLVALLQAAKPLR